MDVDCDEDWCVSRDSEDIKDAFITLSGNNDRNLKSNSCKLIVRVYKVKDAILFSKVKNKSCTSMDTRNDFEVRDMKII